MSSTAEKARAHGLDERTIALAYAHFIPGHEGHNASVLEAHRRVCLAAMAHDNPVGNVSFAQFRGGVFRESSESRSVSRD